LAENKRAKNKEIASGESVKRYNSSAERYERKLILQDTSQVLTLSLTLTEQKDKQVQRWHVDLGHSSSPENATSRK
jgi:hypothetical protein